LLPVADDYFPAIIEARLDGLINFTSFRFFQAGPTRPDVTIAVAVEDQNAHAPKKTTDSDVQIRTTDGGRTVSVLGKEMGDATRLTNFSFLGNVLFMAEMTLIVCKSMPLHRLMSFGSECRPRSSLSAERFSGFGALGAVWLNTRGRNESKSTGSFQERFSCYCSRQSKGK
jgi:hypothetical protein